MPQTNTRQPNVGKLELHEGSILATCIVVSCFIFFLLLRSGFNLRFPDPSLTMPQITVAVVWIAGAYGCAD